MHVAERKRGVEMSEKVCFWPAQKIYEVKKVEGGYYLRADKLDIGTFVPEEVYKEMISNKEIIPVEEAEAIWRSKAKYLL